MKTFSLFPVILALLVANVMPQSANAQWDFTLYDALNTIMYSSGDPETPPACCFYSGTSFQSYYSDQLYDIDNNYTVFVPTDAAVDEVAALMNLNLYDLLAFSDMSDAVGYHIVPGNLHGRRPARWNGPHHTCKGQALDVTVDGTQRGRGRRLGGRSQHPRGQRRHPRHRCDPWRPEGYPQATVVTAIAGSPDHTLFEEGIFNAYLDELPQCQCARSTRRQQR